MTEVHHAYSNLHWEQRENGHMNGQSGANTDFDDDGGANSAKLFERSRIKALADERETVQKKTFTKWVNSHLARVGFKINDLYMDLRDGKMLIKLLEVLSGEKLPRPTKGKMRIHCLENVDKSLTFLGEKAVKLENMGAHDIVDGNSRLTLGLIWTIILRFQIQDIRIEEEEESSEKRSAKDSLLLWCQMKTAGYSNVNVRNFTTSWKDGLAFNAIIHKHRPDLIPFNKLTKANPIANLNNAFNTAEDKLGIASLLDAEDVNVELPDEKSIITYVVTYYHYFNKMKAESVYGRRIGKALNNVLENDKLIKEYETLTSDLLRWIEEIIQLLNEREFENSLQGVQAQLLQFNTYRTQEKPPKFIEKGNLEIMLFTLQSQMRANNQKPYLPKEGKLISDINKAWEALERAEHERELALREELIRQEKLELLANRFNRKAGMREIWLSENQKLVSQDNFGYDIGAVEAATKKHETFETDINAYEERVQAVVAVAYELEQEKYHDLVRINARKENVLRLWNFLLELLRARRTRLELSLQIQRLFQEMLYLLDWMDEMKGRLLSEDFGKHLVSVEDLLQKHTLMEADLKVLGGRVETVNTSADRFVTCDDEEFQGLTPPDYKPCDPVIVEERKQSLIDAFNELLDLAARRRDQLEASRSLWQFFWDVTEEEGWIKDKEQLMSSPDLGHDLTSVNLLLGKHRANEDEITARGQRLEGVKDAGKALIDVESFGAEQIQGRLDEIDNQWQNLVDLSNLRKQRLNEAVDFYQFFADADDVDHWMVDTLRLVSSDDVGRDEANAKSLLKKHKDICDELKSYASVIQGLEEQASQLGEQDRENTDVVGRLASINRRYKDLLQLAELREQRLKDALSLYKFYNDADNVDNWVEEKTAFLQSLEPTADAEELAVVKQRFDTFEKEMNLTEGKVDTVNAQAKELIDSDHPSTEQIIARRDELNSNWEKLQQLLNTKREELEAASGLCNFHIDVNETMTWITEKMKVVESTDELDNDLAGVMALQRRLAGMERDLDAIQAKINHMQENATSVAEVPPTRVANLDETAGRVAEEHPEEAETVKRQLAEINTAWDDLKHMLKSREERLGEASELQRFLQNLDHFQSWLSATQTAVANEDSPSSLTEAEKLLAQHAQIMEDINQMAPEYSQLQEFGAKVTANQTDDQHMFLAHRLAALEEGWNDLKQMWENRQAVLDQSLKDQIFVRDATQCDILLNQQEHFLSKEDVPTTHVDRQASLEQAENSIKQHESFMSTMDANDDKINQTIQYADKLAEEDHYNADKNQRRAADLDERRNANRERARQQKAKLYDTLAVQQFLADCDDVDEWLEEKMIAAQDETYRDAKSIHSKYMRHQAFESEIAANKPRLNKLQENGQDLMEEKPDSQEVVEPRLEALASQWEDLESVTKAKGERLFDANRHIVFEQGCDDVDSYLADIESQIIVSDVGSDLTTVNLNLNKQNQLESDIVIKKEQITKLESEASQLKDPVQIDVIQKRKVAVQERINALEQPIQERRRNLDKAKRVHQFLRDVEDENLWIQDRKPIAEDKNVGNSLQSVQTLQKKNQSLSTEIDNHEPQVLETCDNGRQMIEENYPQADNFQDKIDQLMAEWNDLKGAVDDRKQRLDDSEVVQQYLFDAAEAEAFMGEQELFLMSDERAKDEIGAANQLKKHNTVEQTIDDFAGTVRDLNDRATQLIDAESPESDNVARRQAQVDKLYAGLKDLTSERRNKLEETLKLYMLNREIEDLEQWIAEREVVAGSHELGQDFEHVSMLLERFKDFAKDTKTIGEERVARANDICDQLIDSGHSDAATIAEWKDGVNDAWADLLELIETRTQHLNASWKLHRFFHDCRETLDRILEKQNSIPEELGRDVNSVEALQRKHETFENDLINIGEQVQRVQEEAAGLVAAYAGDKQADIRDREQEVVDAWKNLQGAVDSRKNNLLDASDLYRFFAMVLDLTLWMSDILLQMKTVDKARDVSGVELLMNNHQSLRAEIDARDENFTICINLGKDILAREHFRSNEVRVKLMELQNKRGDMMQQWDDKWDYLQIILEVYQFARDSDAAEAWLLAQDAYITNQELGENLDAVENLIKRHEAFEKAALAQEDRFLALERLTALEQREMRNDQLSAPTSLQSRVSPLIYQKEPYSLSREGSLSNSLDSLLSDTVEQLEAPMHLEEAVVEHVETDIVVSSRRSSHSSKSSNDETISEEAAVEIATIVPQESPVAPATSVPQESPVATLELREQQREYGTLETKPSVRDQYIDDFSQPEEKQPEQEQELPAEEREEASPPPVVEAEPEAVVDAPVSKTEEPGVSDPIPIDVADAAKSSSKLSSPAPEPKKGGGEGAKSPRLEGVIQRKHEWETTGTKASHRTWDKLYAILHDSQVSFYKDQKHARSEPQTLVRGERPIKLEGAVCEVPTDYSKRPHVFRLNLPNGGQYLLQCKSDEEMQAWLRELQEITGNTVTEAVTGKAQTMPAKSSSKKEDSAKKKGKFTLKKNLTLERGDLV
ncbi:spectrin beta chain-like isoform X2 [Watersipora subatra]|uniref:spectrin beta chain-like isoform X2 n=1 Tax=Watersipora subatra TaxID=2589382 RepID=UPI00355C6A42